MAQHFVLVHGAWHGGWCWQGVADRLRAAGHSVTTPTLTGLGERSHLLSDAVTLETHVTDVVAHIEAEDLSDVVLVGHSYGGVVITHVADRIADRLSRLIYLDAQIGANDLSIMDGLAPEIRDQRRAAAAGGLTMAIPPTEAFGISDPAVAAWAAPRLRPHPIATYEQALKISGPIGAGLPVDFILCTDPAFASIGPFAEKARSMGWPVHALPTGHDAMLTAPEATADLLMEFAAP
jgi:pimeloyl-ACP methyl ester carboxylesterase